MSSNTKNTRLLATKFLIAALLLYILSTVLINEHFLFGYLKAFAEAAMVGGVADWFAITALFRHPFGLKIPHTAIIPNSKNKIGRNISHFIRENFLSENYVRDNLKKINFHEKLVIILKHYKESINEKFINTAYEAFLALKYEVIEKHLSQLIKSKINEVDVNFVVLKTIESMTKKNYHQKVVDFLLINTKKWLSNKENEKTINEAIKNIIKKNEDGKTTFSGLVKSFFVGEPKLYKYMDTFMEQIANDPSQTFRKNIDSIMKKIIINMQKNEDINKKIQDIKNDVLENLPINDSIKELYEELRIWIHKDLISNHSLIKKYVSENIDNLILEIETSEYIKEFIIKQTETKIPEFIVKNAEMIDNYFIEYLDKLDEKEMSKLIEDKVGDDLQFIRINGTIIGGLVGLFIYSSTQLINLLIHT